MKNLLFILILIGAAVGCGNAEEELPVAVVEPEVTVPEEPPPPVPDKDKDGVADSTDNCPQDANPDQKDTDADQSGDACDGDDDGDGVSDTQEALSGTNPLKKDTDGDGWDDKVELATASLKPALRASPLKADTDGDGVLDPKDLFPSDATEFKDGDSDGVGDNGDNCPQVSNADQSDLDGDRRGDLCDDDIDGDGLSNTEEALRGGNERAVHSDSDGILDGLDNCPAKDNRDQTDADGDTYGAACDCNFDSNNDNDASIHPNASDNPDIFYIDSNCDGIDGDKGRAIFVDPLRGDDANSGLYDFLHQTFFPVRTLRVGLQKAAAAGRDLYVGAGTYDVRDADWSLGVSVYGSFRTNDTARLFRDRTVRSASSDFKTTLTRTDSDVTLRLENIEKPFKIDGFFIKNEGSESDPLAGTRVVVVNNTAVTFQYNMIGLNQGNNVSPVGRSYGMILRGSRPIVLNANDVTGNEERDAVTQPVWVNGASDITLTNNVFKAVSSAFTVGLEIDNASPRVINNVIFAFGGTARGVLFSYSPSFLFVNNLVQTQTSGDQQVVSCEAGQTTAEARFMNNILSDRVPDPANPGEWVSPADGNHFPLLINCSNHADTNADDGLDFGSAVVSGNIDVDSGESWMTLQKDNGLNVSGAEWGAVTTDFDGNLRTVPYDVGQINR